jgi:uncharacterized protein (UPF0212 family)
MKYEVRLEAETRVRAVTVVEAESDTDAVNVAVAARGNLDWELDYIPTRSEILRFAPCVDELN